jgi:hypothetical protein
MEDPVSAWEGEGGSSSRIPAGHMIGTPNEIAWAIQIKSHRSRFNSRRFQPNDPKT